jgi:hypothetical protein
METVVSESARAEEVVGISISYEEEGKSLHYSTTKEILDPPALV